MDSKTEKRWVSHPPTPEQTERIKAACATTRTNSADIENLLNEIGYRFRTVRAAGNPNQSVAQIKSKARNWRSVSKARLAIKAALKAHGAPVSNPVYMFQVENVIERLAWSNQELDAEDLDAGGRYPYYWEAEDVHLERLAD